MRKSLKAAIGAGLATVGLITVVGLVNGGAPASDAPSSVATRVVHPKSADLNAWATEAAPIMTDVAAQSAKLSDNPLDQSAGAALDKDATAGLHMQHKSGDKDVDLHWKLSMQGARKVAADVRNYDMGAMVADANSVTVDLQWLNKSISAAQ